MLNHLLPILNFEQGKVIQFTKSQTLKTIFTQNRWGLRLKKRLGRIESWAEKQGLELAADCHLARVVQAAHLLLARKNTAEDIASVSSICFKLNSLQLKTLLNKVPFPQIDQQDVTPEIELFCMVPRD